MNKFFKGGIICGLAAILLIMTVTACSGKKDGDSASGGRATKKADPESDFRAKPTYDGKGVEITEYRGGKWEVSIPSQIQGLPVTEISLYDGGAMSRGLTGAFQGKNLIKVTIPNSITSIGRCAFADNKLTSVTIPNSVNIIGYLSFYGNSLTSVTIGANYVGYEYDSNLGNKFDETQKYLEFYAFDDNTFYKAYENAGKAAGTYTRPNAESTVWTKK
jgi:hypothetical protein